MILMQKKYNNENIVITAIKYKMAYDLFNEEQSHWHNDDVEEYLRKQEKQHCNNIQTTIKKDWRTSEDTIDSSLNNCYSTTNNSSYKSKNSSSSDWSSDSGYSSSSSDSSTSYSDSSSSSSSSYSSSSD